MSALNRQARNVRRQNRARPFGRAARMQFIDGPGMGRIRYLHPNKGWRERRLTQQLFMALVSGAPS